MRVKSVVLKDSYFTGVDIIKLLCALLVLFTHTYCFDMGRVGNWIQMNLSLSCVPFFFISSGFFFGKGLKKAEDDRVYFRNSFLRLGIMYVFWFLVTLPVAWINWMTIKPEENTFVRILRVFRSFFLSGGMGVYWYILSLLCIYPVLFLLHKRPRLKIIVFPVSIVLLIIGFLYYDGSLNGGLVYEFIHVLFGSERNFLTSGLFYVCLGSFFASYEKRLEINTFLTVLLFISALAVGTFLMKPLGNAVIAIFLFIFAINWSPNISSNVSFHIRKLSTGIYLLHFPFIIMFDLYLHRGTFVDFFVTLMFSLVVYYLSKVILPKQFLKFIFG